MKIRYVFPLLIVFLAACQHRETQSSTLQQAADIHNDMLIRAALIETMLTRLERDTAGMVPRDSITQWRVLLEAWEADIVEVPGNTEHHHHDGGHRHHVPVDVTDEQMLIIQQTLSGRLDSLRQRIQQP